MKRYASRAFILAKFPRGETDSVLVAFTENHGKLMLRAAGERKVVSKLRSGLEPLSLVFVEFVEGKTLRVTDAVSENRFLSIKNNLARQRTARAVSELVDEFTKEGELDERVWGLLVEWFSRLSSSSSNSPLLYHYFLWKFFSILGYEIHSSSCVSCGEGIGGSAALVSELGGFQCSRCCERPELLVSHDVISAAQDFLAGTPGSLSRSSFRRMGLTLLSDSYLSFVKASVQ